MADKEKQTTGRTVSPDERLHYIGFEVFPGKPKPLFRSDTEKAKLVEIVQQKRSKGDLLREQCSLMLQRVSSMERMVLAAACVLILLSFFVPWYSAYNEIVEQSQAPTVTSQQESSGGEVITAAQVHKKTRREVFNLSGIGSLASIGSAGGRLFSSGFALMLTGLLMIVYTLLSIVLPIYVLMAIFKPRGTPDEAALRLKKLLRYNWIPIIIFAFVLFLSIMGADYGSGTSGLFTSLGQSYGTGALLSTMSWGLLITLGGFLVLAAKGIEI
jgi:hypothetical protein